MRDRVKWPMWKVVLAYLSMSALPVGSVWFIDQKVNHLPAPGASDHVAPAVPVR